MGRIPLLVGVIENLAAALYLASTALDRNLAGLSFFRHRDNQLEDSVHILRLYLVKSYPITQGELAGKSTEGAFVGEPLSPRDFRRFALGTNSEGAILDIDIYAIRIYPRQIKEGDDFSPSR